MTQAIALPEIPTNVKEDSIPWTSADLELLPENGNRYEIINGELCVTRAPHWKHQKTCGRLFTALDIWSIATKLGETAMGAGVIFGDKDDVIPDVVWVSKEKYEALIDESGHLLGAPDLAIRHVERALTRDAGVPLLQYALAVLGVNAVDPARSEALGRRLTNEPTVADTDVRAASL